MCLTAAMRSASVSQRPGDGTSDPSTAFSDENGGECIASVIENRAKEVPFEPRVLYERQRYRLALPVNVLSASFSDL